MRGGHARCEVWRRVVVVAALILLATTASLHDADGQATPVETYYVNDGVNDQYDNAFGEFSNDLFGWVPWSRYGNSLPNTGHFFARAWTLTSPTFQQMMYKGALDLDYLGQQINTYCNFAGAIPPALPPVMLPIQPDHVFPEPNLPAFPIVDFAWWNSTYGSTNGTARPVLYWPYKINGGSMMICLAGDYNYPLGQYEPVYKGVRSVMLFHYSSHLSDFGTNKNAWHNTESRPREFSVPEGGFDPAFSLSVLGPKEQALEAGDVVIFIGENYGQDFWTSLQRTQEAEWFTRHQFAQGPPSPPGNAYTPFVVDYAFIHGGSWGQIVAGILGLLQPKTYGGAANWIESDIGYGINDYFALRNHFDVFFGRFGWKPVTDTTFTHFYTLVDLLGTRFDSPKYGRSGWDLAALSMNRRPGDLQAPVFGGVGDNETIFPAAWARDDHQLVGTLGTFHHPDFLRNREHQAMYGYVPGVNEYTVFKGNEWATLKSSINSTPPTENEEISPTNAAPPVGPSNNYYANIYPDPYSHTLRHVHQTSANNLALLTQADLQNGMTPEYRRAPSQVKGIGQGIFPGFRDSMHVADLDNDGNMEVVFGNLDGYVHILEFQGNQGYINNPPTCVPDPYRLLDEWQSPYLGYGLIGSDALFVGQYAHMYFSDSKGNIWNVNATGNDSYTITGGMSHPVPIAHADGSGNLYQGATPILLVNEFDGSTNNGKEIVALNRFLDFSMFSSNGTPIAYGRRVRDAYVVGPTDAFPYLPSGSLSKKDLLVTAVDGNLWKFDWNVSLTKWFVERALPTFTGLALYHVVPFLAPAAGGAHTCVLLFGANSDLNDTNPLASTNVIQLWDIATGTMLATTTGLAGDSFSNAMSFAWITKPTGGNGSGSFVVAGDTALQIFTVNASPSGSNINAGASLQVFVIPDADTPAPDCITAVEAPVLADGCGGSSQCIVFATGSGRIYVLDTNLQYLRTSDKDVQTTTTFSALPWPSGASPAPLPWPSNRTFARTYACDLNQPPNANAKLYLAEYPNPFWKDTAHGNKSHCRLSSIEFGANGSNTWNAYEQDAVNDKNSTIWDSSDLSDKNRRLMYRDVDANGTPEARIFAESGTAYLDTTQNPPVVREFQTAAFAPSFISNNVPLGAFWEFVQGGRVFELPANRNAGQPGYASQSNPGYQKAAYGYLGSFTVPPYGGMPYTNFGSGANGWWYPVVGASFLTGQIADLSMSAESFSYGASVSHALIRRDSNATSATDHIVVGTDNGFVFAIEPGNPNASGGLVSSNLRYASHNLGSFVIALDVGNLDGDVDDEIVCGCWIDDGTYVNWNNHNLSKNRGHLYILDPVPSNGTNQDFSVTVLDGDDLFPNPPNGNGIGSGVTGVKIDDVNGDGTKEIWCSDALHLYLFSQKTGSWKCVFQSGDLCGYPGFYNNIFPIKDTNGKTTKLVVVSPGYTLLFDVNHSVVP